MKIYLAACFRQQAEVRTKADELTTLGHECTSRWRFEPPKGDGSEPESAEHYMRAAAADLEDINRADVLVLLTGNVSTTGGKHFELGYAIGSGKMVVLVGPVENVFHWALPRYGTWKEFLCHLSTTTV